MKFSKRPRAQWYTSKLFWRQINLQYDQRRFLRGLLIQWSASAVCHSLSDIMSISCAKIIQNEPFSTAERSERVENSLFRATREYTEAGIEQAIVAMLRLGANSPELRKRTVRDRHVSTQKTGSYITERSRLPGLIVGPCPSEESLCCPACPPALPCFRRVSAPSL